jgi:hypothetical protein
MWHSDGTVALIELRVGSPGALAGRALGAIFGPSSAGEPSSIRSSIFCGRKPEGLAAALGFGLLTPSAYSRADQSICFCHTRSETRWFGAHPPCNSADGNQESTQPSVSIAGYSAPCRRLRPSIQLRHLMRWQLGPLGNAWFQSASLSSINAPLWQRLGSS